MKITVEKKKVSRTGRTYQFFHGAGYIVAPVTVKAERWCVLKDGKVVAECRSKGAADEIAAAFDWVGHCG